MMLATVYRTEAGMVMAFDETGREVPGLQGPYTLVKPRLLAAASPDTVFKHWFGAAEGPVEVGIEEF